MMQILRAKKTRRELCFDFMRMYNKGSRIVWPFDVIKVTELHENGTGDGGF